MKKKLLFSLLSFYFILNYGQNKNIGINTTDPKTTLHINANSTGTVAEGLIIPRLTGDQIKNMPVTTTENGMMIFATSGAASPSGTAININSEGFYFWNSVNNVWEKLNANPANTAWALSGNTATATSFLGTTNNIDLQFKRNNTLVGKLSNSNISFGLYALNPATTGSYNNALGYYSLGQNTTGTYNNALGMYSLRVNTTGAGNNAIGYYSLGSNSTGNYNSAYGYQSLQYTTGSNNIGIGYNSAVPTTSGSNQMSIGNSIYGLNINDGNASNDLIGIGVSAPTEALDVNGNARIRSVYTNNGAATDRVVVADTNGNIKTIDRSMINNIYTADGTITGNRIVTLNGGNIRFAKTGTAITGSLMEVDGKIKTTAVNLNSDARLKEKVANINQETSFLNNLRPVSYYWNAKGKEKGGDNSLQYGFIAQEVEKIAPNLVNTDADGYKSVNYIQVIPVLVKSLQDHALELQKEKEKNNQQEQRIKALEEKINAILKK